ncbi:MAG: AAA family ATPase, partial [Desulfobacterales bacterium]
IQSLGGDTMVATIYDPSLQVLDFFNIVSVAFNMGRTFGGKGEFLIYFKRFLKEVRKRNKKVLMIIDEAQRISSELLEEIRLLSNLEDEHIRLLNIFFVGQNEFVDTLKEYKNRALRQRITIRYHIEPLTLNETGAYIRHRLKTAGATTPIFSVDAIHEIFSFSKGYPRMINIICDHALLSGYVREIRNIDKDVIRECKEELKISTLTSGFHTYNSDHEGEFKSEAPFIQEVPVIQRQERPEKRDIRFRSVIIGIGLLAVIGSLTGYAFYNKIKTKAEPRENLFSVQGKTSYSGQTEEKNDLQTNVTTVPEKKTHPIPSKVEIGKVGDSRYYIVKDPEPKLFREIDTSKEKNLASMPSEAIAGQADAQEIPGGVREPEAYDAFTKIVPKESKITQIAPEKPKTTPQKDLPIDLKVGTVTSSPSEKQAVRITTGFSDSVQKPRVAAVSEKDKQPVKTAAIRESATARVALPAKKPLEKKVVVPRKKPEGKKAVVPAKKPEEKEVVRNAKQKKVAALRKGIKPEGVAGDKFVRTDLQSRLNAFLNEYCQTYEKEQLNKFAAFFTPDAMEKGKSFTSRLGQYRRTFGRIDAMDYRINLKRYAIQEGTGVIRIEGIFYVKARLDGSSTWRKSSGPIEMELLANGDSFKVRRLDY